MEQPVRQGRFIVLEGMEGSGKTTQKERLVAWLAARGIPHLATREPGGTAVGEEVRRLLLEWPSLPDRVELLLFLAARAAVVAEVVRPALAEGRVVVADRFDLSTLAYQGHGRGLPIEAVRAANRLATDGLEPDLTIVLDVPVAVGVARLAARAGRADRIERAGDAFHERVAEAYRLLSQSEQGVAVVDATRLAGEVHEEIVRILTARFPETFAETAG